MGDGTMCPGCRRYQCICGEPKKIVEFCDEVDRKAQELMMLDGSVSGKHYAAMRLVLKERYGIDWGR